MATGSRTDVIKDASDFLAYTDEMTPHLALLGTVLGVGDFATAILGEPGSLQMKCRAILKRWLEVNLNPTWKLFCDKLEANDTFNSLRARIAQDINHGVSELIPSDAGLQGILSIAPLWRQLAISLGVPITTVQANELTPLGGMLCLSYWRDGRCGEAYPHTWRFLLKTVKDTFGPLVAEKIEKKAYSEPLWSELPVQLPGPSTLKMADEVFPGSLDIDSEETSSSKYSGAKAFLYVSERFLIPGIKMTYPELCPEQEMNVRGNREFVAGLMSDVVSEMKWDPTSELVAVNHEEDLLRLCWIPFGIQTLTVDPKSDDRTFLLQPNTVGCGKDDLIRLEVPKGAINTDVCKELSIRSGILVHGPFVLEKDYELVSMVVYIYFNPDHTTEPLMLHLPHWVSEGEATSVVVAPHKADEAEGYKFNTVDAVCVSTSAMTTTVTVKVSGHSSLLAVKAYEKEGRRDFFAIPWERCENNETILSVYFTYASQVWLKFIRMELIQSDYEEQPMPFTLEKTENSVIPELEHDTGPGWKAHLIGIAEVTHKKVEYKTHGIDSSDDLEEAVLKNKCYPPVVRCIVECTDKALKAGQQTSVILHFKSENKGQKKTVMTFRCKTLYEESSEGSKADMGDNQPDGAVQDMKQTSAIHDVLKGEIRKTKGYQKFLRNMVARHIGLHLNALANNLGVGSGGFIANHPHNMEDAAAALLIHWAEGNTGKTPIWSDILKAMRESGMAKEANELEDCLRGEPGKSKEERATREDSLRTKVKTGSNTPEDTGTSSSPRGDEEQNTIVHGPSPGPGKDGSKDVVTRRDNSILPSSEQDMPDSLTPDNGDSCCCCMIKSFRCQLTRDTLKMLPVWEMPSLGLTIEQVEVKVAADETWIISSPTGST